MGNYYCPECKLKVGWIAEGETVTCSECGFEFTVTDGQMRLPDEATTGEQLEWMLMKERKDV